MKCQEARSALPLFLYGELSFEAEERLELHLDACAGCREALAREKTLHRSLDACELAPEPALLAECRHELLGRLPLERSSRAGFWDRLREMMTSVRFHPLPAAMQPFGALALLAAGFLGARLMPLAGDGQLRASLGSEPVSSRVRYVEPVSAGRVQIVVDETRQRTLSGALGDQSIQKLLLAAAKDPGDPGLRVESVDLLKSQSESAEVRGALLYALQHDANPGVRLKALDGLKSFGGDPETRKVLTQALLTDNNPGVRTEVIDLLIQHKGDAMVGVLQELMRKEDNGYVRMRCQKALHEMNASVETF